MLEEIKKMLLDNPTYIKDVLEYFGYENIKIHKTYMSFGRDAESSKKSIIIRLQENKYLYVCDYARNYSADIFSFIIKQRQVEFKDVLNVIKSVLGIKDFNFNIERNVAFGGFYERIRTKRNTQCINIYNESILEEYAQLGNTRFLKDNISLDTQKYFQIGYDVANQAITIPIRDQIGRLMGIKERVNYDVDIESGELKYYYAYPCAMSKTLFGYSQNYQYLCNEVVLIFEAEKSVMQCYSYGIRNAVSLGSSSLSTKQIQMLLELNPKKILFMHDYGLEKKYIERNIDVLKNYSRFSEIEIGYWDYFNKTYFGKVSPSDMGKEELLRILDNEITMIGDDTYEEEL